MIINHANLTSFFTGLKTQFRNSLASGEEPIWPLIATLVPSRTSSEDYGWIGEAPGLREWLGNRQINRLIAHDYSLKNRKFEDTIGVARDAIEDDQTGMYSLWASSMGAAARMWPDDIVFEAFNAGDTAECYDNQYFFDIDHPVGRDDAAVSVSNLLNDGGAMAAHPWYLLDTSKPLKPMIWQLRYAPDFVPRVRLDDPQVFMLDEYLAGVRARGAAGYGLWQAAIRNEAAMTLANIQASISAMRAFENDEGRLLKMNPNILMCGAYHEWTAKELVQAMFLDDDTSTPNPIKGLQVVIAPDIP